MDRKHTNDLVILSKSEIENMLLRSDVKQLLYTAMQNAPLFSGEPITNLYRDPNGALKISQTFPPDENSFPVFAHPTSVLDIARLVIDDLADIIVSKGSMNLWKEIVEKVNTIYTHATPQPDRAAELEAKLKVAVEALNTFSELTCECSMPKVCDCYSWQSLKESAKEALKQIGDL